MDVGLFYKKNKIFLKGKIVGKQYKKLTKQDISFIENQNFFYIASCSKEEVNLSPKGYDSIRVIDIETLIFANYPGSGNRTYRDANNDGNFTLVFNAFEGSPKILRLFCKAKIVTKDDKNYKNYLNLFNIKPTLIRDVFELKIYAVESSCGMSIPIMEYKKDRDEFKNGAIDMDSKNMLEDYKNKNFTPPNLKNID